MSVSGGDGDQEADDESVVVQERNVEVTKSHDTERFPVPAVVLSIRSERAEPIELRLADRVPEGVSMDDIGFHPEHGSEFWSVEGRTLVFERELEPEAEIETVYGLRGPNADAADRFLGEPTIEVWTEEEDGSFLDDINDELVRSGTFDDGENGATTDDDESDASDESDGSSGAIEADEPAESDDAATAEDTSMDESESTPTSAETAEDTSTAEADAAGRNEDEEERNGIETEPDGEIVEQESGEEATDDTLAATLAHELRSGRIDAEDRETLRDLLGPRESVGARIEHLRSQVNDVAAYADALEEFLDENGRGQTLLRKQEERTDALREEIGDVTEQAATNRADIETVADDVATIEDEVEGVEGHVETVEGEVETIENDVATISRDVEAFQDAVSDLDAEIERIDERFASIDDRLEAMDDRVEEVEDRLTGIDERLDAIEETHESDLTDLRDDMETRIDERVSGVERSTEAVAADVEALEAWRAQLAGALGAGQEPNERPGSSDEEAESGDEES